MTEAMIICQSLQVAKRPEDIFGAIHDGPLPERLLAVKRLFNDFIKVIHPDKNPGLADAGKHVARLMKLRAEAEKCLKDGTYGKPRKAAVKATLRSKAAVYEVVEEYRTGEVADLFVAETGGKRCLLKIVRQPSDNDMLDNEARVLAELHRQSGDKAKVFRKYLPKLVGSFDLVQDRCHRRVNVLDLAEPEAEYVRKLKEKKGLDADLNYFSLAEIRAAYPDGIDVRDAVWMIRRAFEGIGWVHSVGYVHGAMLPEHIIVHPTEHGARLVGWSYAVRAGRRITAISAGRKSMYPKSVFKREPAKPVLDVQLIGETAALLLSDRAGRPLADVPKDVATFFAQCRAGAISDGWEAYRAYDAVLGKTFGKRTYRAFEMPRK